MSAAEKTSMSTTKPTEMSMIKPATEDNNLKFYNNKFKAKAIKKNCDNDKSKQPEQQLQCNRQHLDYNFYEFKTHRIPRVQNKNNDNDDYDYNNVKNDTITIDSIATTIGHLKSMTTTKNFMIFSIIIRVDGCGNVGANSSNCRNIKIFLRLSLRYFYDENCEFVKNII